MFKKILVPLDGSELSLRSLDMAIKLAARANGEVFLLRVPMFTQMVLSAELAESDASGLEYANRHDRLIGIAAQYLLDVAVANEHPDVIMYTIVAEGNPDEVILEVAEQQDIDLIIMTTHERTGPARWIMGSTTQKVLKSTTRPALVLRTGQLGNNNVLVPLDGSEAAENALPFAAEITRAMSGSMILTHTVAKNKKDKERSFRFEVSPKKYLQGLANQYNPLVPRLQIHSNIDKPAWGILKSAEMLSANLIVMSSHGHNYTSPKPYGDVAAKVLKDAPCSMLMIPA